jgi:HPt (histidine-containing phosphotransfer) domain-containing protein
MEDEPNPDHEIADLLPGYLANRRADLPSIHKALSAGEFDRVRVLAHNMKGSGAGYGCATLSEIGGRMEAAAKIGDMVAVEEELAAMTEWLGRVAPDQEGA